MFWNRTLDQHLDALAKIANRLLQHSDRLTSEANKHYAEVGALELAIAAKNTEAERAMRVRNKITDLIA